MLHRIFALDDIFSIPLNSTGTTAKATTSWSGAGGASGRGCRATPARPAPARTPTTWPSGTCSGCPRHPGRLPRYDAVEDEVVEQREEAGGHPRNEPQRKRIKQDQGSSDLLPVMPTVSGNLRNEPSQIIKISQNFQMLQILAQICKSHCASVHFANICLTSLFALKMFANLNMFVNYSIYFKCQITITSQLD